jgi:serine/threonine protein kinase
MIAFSCPSCGKGLKVKEAYAGRKGKCPSCQGSVDVPAASVAVAQADKHPPVVEDTVIAPQEGGINDPGGAAAPTPTPEKADQAPVPAELINFLAPAQASGELGRLGKYRVLDLLGTGGMGVVYKAEDPQLQRPVALKAMLPNVAVSPINRQRFIREARAAAALAHPNIVTIYEVEEDRGIPYLAMQFLQGETLEERILRDAPLPVEDLLRIGREIAEGLAVAHDAGLIHRDIKPANIWLESASGNRLSAAGQNPEPITLVGENRKPKSAARVKILDFGLARGTCSETTLTQDGVIVGTPTYMSPEQAGGKQIDGRSDLFSLGCVLYRAATWKLPFHGSDTMAILLALATKEPKPPIQRNPQMPQALSDLILKLLAKDPNKRFASAHEVVEALQGMERQRLVEQTQFSAEPLVVELVADVLPAEVPARPARGRDDRDAITTRDRLVDRPRSRRGKPEPESNTALLVAGAGLLAVVLVAGLVTFFTLRRKTTSSDNDRSAGPPSQALVTPPPPPRDPPRDADLGPNKGDVPGSKGPPPFVKGPGPNKGDIPDSKGLPPFGKGPGPNKGDSPRPRDNPPPPRSGWQPILSKRLYPTGLVGMSFSPDGNLLAVHTEKATKIDLWDPQTSVQVRQFGPVSADVEQLGFSPDGSKLAAFSAGSSGHILLWDAVTGQVIAQAAAPPMHHIVGMSFTANSNGLHYALAPRGPVRATSAVKIIDLLTRKEVAQLKDRTASVRRVLLTPDGRRAVCLDMDESIHVFDLPFGKSVATSRSTQRSLDCFAMTSDGKKLFTSHHEPRVLAWNLDTGKELSPLIQGGGTNTTALAVSADGHSVVVGGANGLVRLVDPELGKLMRQHPGPSALRSVAISSNGHLVATGGEDGTLELLRVR